MRQAGLFLIVHLVAAAAASAQARLKVEAGWDGQFVVGKWTPLFLTLSDDSPRSVSVEVTFSHGGNRQMRIRQPMTIGPTPATFVVYVLPGYTLSEELRIDVRDARSGRRLASHPDRGLDDPTGVQSASARERLIGTSGRRGFGPTTLPPGPLSAIVGHLPPERLPTAAMLYDGLAALVLNAPDLTALTPAHQQAIADWVRAGGTLFFWPDENALPDASPLLDLLPARIGAATLIDLDAATLARLDLPDRYAKLRGRVLTPRDGATPVDLLGVEAARGYESRVGFGRVVVLPFDLALVRLPERVTQPLWKLLLEGPESRNTYGSSTVSASVQAMEQVGQIPGAGRFPFSAVALTLAGLMLVVGPIDWFVLKKLNRQPWTWATTLGWIGLVTAAAIYAGSLLNSGDLHLRTLRVIDEIDGVQVRRADFVGLYAPTTAVYDLQVDPTLWWQPAPDGNWWGRQGLVEDYAFRQTPDGTVLQPALVRIWNLRFFLGQAITNEPGTLEAKLKRVGDRIEGTITNRGEQAVMVHGIHLRVPPAPDERTADATTPIFINGVWESATPAGWRQAMVSKRLDPGQSLEVSAPIVRRTDRLSAAGLAGLDAGQIDRLLMQRTHAMIDAAVIDPPAVASIAGRESRAKHRVQVRAFVPLETQEPTP
jgi:hypothetical protein